MLKIFSQNHPDNFFEIELKSAEKKDQWVSKIASLQKSYEDKNRLSTGALTSNFDEIMKGAGGSSCHDSFRDQFQSVSSNIMDIALDFFSNY